MKKLLIAILFCLVIPLPCYGADFDMKWDSVEGATGYVIYISTDYGETWDEGTDVGNVTEYTYEDVPCCGLSLFVVSAYNDYVESGLLWSGCFCNPQWKLGFPSGLGAK